ncbi:MAG: hypothetical protein JNG84_08930 [Archangium sp.]|nr:hypothetical protein [Archangium sp.]
MTTSAGGWLPLVLAASVVGCGRDALLQPLDAEVDAGASCIDVRPFCVADCAHDGLSQSTCLAGAWRCPAGTRRLDTCPASDRDAGEREGRPRDGGSTNDAGTRDAGVNDGGTTSTCAGLEASRCRRTAGCVVDTCTTCSCTPTFRGCRAVSAPPLDCPAVGCLQPTCCRSSAECPSPTSCVPPHVPVVCGICIGGPTCESHADCPSGEMCRLDGACSCTSEGRCVPGCTDDGDCREGELCTSQRRCITKTCVRENECGPSFACQAGLCVRKTCVSRDDECSPNGDSFCVMGHCASGWGECRLPGA